MDLVSKRDLNRGFGDALARAFELVTTPAIFGFLGWLLDGKVGTRPLFTLLFGIVVLSYVVWKMCVGYEHDMRRHETKLGLRSSSERHPDRPGSP